MKDPKKKPTSKAYELEMSAIGELRLEKEVESELKPLQPVKKEPLSEDLIQRLINCVKKI